MVIHPTLNFIMYPNLARRANFHALVLGCGVFFSAVQGFAFMERIYNSTKSACLLVGCSMEVCQYGEVVSHTSQAGKDL